MKKRFLQWFVALLVCVSMLAATAIGTFAAEAPAGQGRVENAVNNYHVTVYFTGNEGLALKAAPSTDAARLLMIPEGTELYISQTSGYWGYTSYNGSNGWVFLKYTRIRGDYPTVQPAFGFITPVYYTVYDTGGEGLELRKTASADDSTFGPMMDGTVVKAEAVSGDWVYVENNGHYGWCHTYFLRGSTPDEISRYEQMHVVRQEAGPAGAEQNTPGQNTPGSEQSAPGQNVPGSEQSAPGQNVSDPGNPADGQTAAQPGDPADDGKAANQTGPGFSEDDREFVASTCIDEYNGTVYILSKRNTDLEELPVAPAKYQYICSFAFYNGKVYYCCKEAGTSDYHMALFESNPDGTGQKELYDPGTTDEDLNYFALKDGFLYFSDPYWQNSQKMETWYRIDLASNTTSVTQEVPEDVRTAVSQSKGYYVKDDRKFYGSEGIGILMENGDGSTEVLVQTGYPFRLEGVTTADTPDDLYIYYSICEVNEAYLYRMKLSTRQQEYVDSHMAVGGGIYFNW